MERLAVCMFHPESLMMANSKTPGDLLSKKLENLQKKASKGRRMQEKNKLNLLRCMYL